MATETIQPTVYLVIAGSAMAFSAGDEVVETVEWTADGKPDWTDAGICDPRGGGGTEGYRALVAALLAAEANAGLLGFDIIRVAA